MGIHVLILAIAAALWTLFVTSWRHRVRIRARLHAPLSLPQESIVRLRAILGSSTYALGTVTLLDLIYTATRRAPELLEYFDRLDANSELNHVFDVLPQDALTSASTHLLDPDTWGHVDVEGAAGMAMYSADVSATLHDASVGRGTLALLAPDDSATALDSLTALDFTDVAFHIPIYAIAIRGIRNYGKVVDGHLSDGEAILQTGVEVLGSSTGGAMGLALGTKLGVALAPATGGFSLILVLLGPLAGIFVGGKVTKALKIWWHGDDFKRAKRSLESAQSRLNRHCIALRKAFLDHYPTLQRCLQEQHRSNLEWMRREWRTAANVIRRWLFPTVKSMALREIIHLTKREFRTVVQPYYEKLHAGAVQRGGVGGGALIFGQGKTQVFGIPVLRTRYPGVHEALSSAFDRIPGAIHDVRQAAEVLKEEQRKLEAKL